MSREVLSWSLFNGVSKKITKGCPFGIREIPGLQDLNRRYFFTPIFFTPQFLLFFIPIFYTKMFAFFTPNFEI